MADYIRDLRQAKWGLGVNLHGSNPKRSMSALGQKRTSGGCPSDVRFYPQKQTSELTRITFTPAASPRWPRSASLRRAAG